MTTLPFTDEDLDAAEMEAHEAVQRIMNATPVEERTAPMRLLLSTVTHAAFTSQILARGQNISPDEWQDHFLSVVATALVQFNYDTLGHLSKAEIAAHTIQAGVRFNECMADTISRMMHAAPDAPSRPLNS